METAIVGTETTEPVGEQAAATTPESGTTVAREAIVGERAEPHPKADNQVVIHWAMIEDVVLLLSAPMAEAGSSSRGGLELSDDDLVDPDFVSLSMESWCRTENWIKVRCKYPKFSCQLKC
jgi:hypothetical protein